MASLRYVVVEFEKEAGSHETSVEVVPETWKDTEGHQCYLYPAHYSDNRILKAAKKGEPPTDQWTSYPVRREWLTTDSWEKANRRCNKIAVTSNPSDSEGEEDVPKKRRRRLPARYEEEDSDQHQQSEIQRVDQSDESSPDVQPVRRFQNLPAPPASSNFKDERMFILLEKVIERLDRQQQLLMQIAERQQVPLPVDTDDGEDAPALPPLPCESKEALNELNTLLDRSHTARQKLARIISLVGGTGHGVCFNSLKRIVGHEVSKTFNFRGTKGKHSFAELKNLHAVLIKGIRANKGMRDTSEREIALWAGRWFTNARDRRGERHVRKQVARTIQEAPAASIIQEAPAASIIQEAPAARTTQEAPAANEESD
ncbi:uncharacterized protein [Diadema setosum]|uniref:uncharacterized protein n=1 Tax=Diadema setosum TaxID=31175 RepID=UPI003B3A8219